MPRPTKRTDEALLTILDALHEGKSKTEAYRLAGLDDNTFYRWYREDKVFSHLVTMARFWGCSERTRTSWRMIQAKKTGYERGLERYARAKSGDRSCLWGVGGWSAQILKEVLGTHEYVFERDKRGQEITRFWRVSKPKRWAVPRCGAKTRKGTPCCARPLSGKTRCKFHGGMSTGPRTEAGRAAIAESNRRRSVPCLRKSLSQGEATA